VAKTRDFYVTSISMQHLPTEFHFVVHPVNQHAEFANRIPWFAASRLNDKQCQFPQHKEHPICAGQEPGLIPKPDILLPMSGINPLGPQLPPPPIPSFIGPLTKATHMFNVVRTSAWDHSIVVHSSKRIW